MPTKKTRPEAFAPSTTEAASSARPGTTNTTASTRVSRTTRSRASQRTTRPPAKRGERRNPERATSTKTKTGRHEARPKKVVTDDDIRMRAYFLYLEHGPQGGTELDYWVRAERELKGE